MAMGDGKARNVIEYLDNLVDKGKATRGAINPLKVAFAKVVQTIDGDQWEDTDIRSIDVDDYAARFANLTMGKYAPESLTVYKSRMNKAIVWYIQFLDKPGWTPDVQKRSQTAKATVKQSKNGSKKINVTSPPASISLPTAEATSSITNTPNRILYPYPLSDGQLVHISLPIKLSKSDAKRIAAFIESIAIEETQHEKY